MNPTSYTITIPSVTFTVTPTYPPKPSTYLRPNGKSLVFRPVLQSTFIRP